MQKALNFDFRNVLGVLITHSHQDHCKYVTNFALNGIDIYSSKETFEQLKLKGHRFKEIKALEQFKLDNFLIKSLPTEHDCEGSLAFIVYDKLSKEKLLYATDTYYLRYTVPNLNYILIECNYISEMSKENVEGKKIDRMMYQRLLESHFSLNNVVNFLKANDLRNTRKIILCHLSNRNSDEKIMQETVQNVTNIETIIAKPNINVDLELYPF